MQRRLELQTLLESLEGLGSDNVYFQAPHNTQLVYPCLVYKRDSALTLFADNNPYRHTQRYQLTVMDEDPDSLILPEVAALPMCVFVRSFTSGSIYHDIYTLYF